MMKRKPPALRTIGIDLDGRAIEAFRCDYEVELGARLRAPVSGRVPVRPVRSWFTAIRRICAAPASRTGATAMTYEEADHEALLALLKALPCAAMVSGYPSALYDDRLGGWGSVSLQAMNRAGVVTEKVWFNFKPDRLHWARYAGRNFTHRQSVKRKAENWGRRYRSMPPAERLAVLAALMAVEAEPS